MVTNPSDRCPTCKRRHKRSTQANRRYWALLHVMADQLAPMHRTYSVESWHLYFKQRFLGSDDVKLPSGKVLTVPHSTADLDTSAFHDYATEVEAWANEHGAFLEDMPA